MDKEYASKNFIFCGQKIDLCNFRTTSKQVRLTLAILESKVLAKQL